MKIKYFIIHCAEHVERKNYIDTLQIKLNQEIEIFNGINTKVVNLNDQNKYIETFNKNIRFDNKTNFKFFFPGQIGCYLSHFKLVEKIMNEQKQQTSNSEYSVIFEDDVVLESGLHDKIQKIISDLESRNHNFDLIFLGNQNNNRGINLVNNIYFLDETNDCWGTHALLIKNQNIEKIYNINCNIKHAIDVHYTQSINNKEINGLVIYPSICFANTDLKSNINY